MIIYRRHGWINYYHIFVMHNLLPIKEIKEKRMGKKPKIYRNFENLQILFDKTLKLQFYFFPGFFFSKTRLYQSYESCLFTSWISLPNFLFPLFKISSWRINKLHLSNLKKDHTTLKCNSKSSSLLYYSLKLRFKVHDS